MKKLRVAVIGIGHLGKFHARVYSELNEAELVGLCDMDTSQKEKADLYEVPFYSDYKELLGKVDAVSIVTPTITHHEVAKFFLEAGVHTLIEKPITLDLAQADELIEIAKKNNCALQVGHIERHNPGFKHLSTLAKNIRFFEVHRLGPYTGRINDCGVVLDLMIHDLDIVLDLAESPIKSIDAAGINVLTPFEDIANVRLRFENGAVANITASRLTFEKQRKIRVFQEDGYISLDYEKQSCKFVKKVGDNITQETVEIEKAEPLKEELRFFLTEILENRSQGKPDLAARNALDVALQIVSQIKENAPLQNTTSS